MSSSSSSSSSSSYSSYPFTSPNRRRCSCRRAASSSDEGEVDATSCCCGGGGDGVLAGRSLPWRLELSNDATLKDNCLAAWVVVVLLTSCMRRPTPKIPVGVMTGGTRGDSAGVWWCLATLRSIML